MALPHVLLERLHDQHAAHDAHVHSEEQGSRAGLHGRSVMSLCLHGEGKGDGELTTRLTRKTRALYISGGSRLMESFLIMQCRKPMVRWIGKEGATRQIWCQEVGSLHMLYVVQRTASA